jgi:uncharacterized protein (TIGR02145 family)
MKKAIFLMVLLSVICNTYAQNMTISFQPKADITPIDSIWAINLRTSQVVKLLGGESLVLVKTTTGINSYQNDLEKGTIFPNPTNKSVTLNFLMTKSQLVKLRLLNSNGQILKQSSLYLADGMHQFELKFSSAGIYFVSILKSDFPECFKVVYTGLDIQNNEINYIGSETINSRSSDANQLKNAATDKTLAYSAGDFIQYSVFSGVNTTIISETPTTNKTITVEFVSCIDKAGKSYKAVKIGDQWWMAENLAYLPAVFPSSSGSNVEPRYYVSGYQSTDVVAAKKHTNYSTYGVLYNWQAALAANPPGWHLPSDTEWTALSTFLGGQGVTGGKLKENGTLHWNSPNDGATNETGYTALPAGARSDFGTFVDRGNYGYWWSSTEDNQHNGWYYYHYMRYIYGDLFGFSYTGEDGYSVRCVKD